MNYFLYSGAGNTFALVEHPISPTAIQKLCEQSAADGVIFTNDESRMRYFNRDGSEAEMCGNGLRCFVRFLIEKGSDRALYHIETLSGTHAAWADGDQICVQLPPPSNVKWNLQIEEHTLHFLNLGVPHAVVFVDSVENVNLNTLGPLFNTHPLFPEGVNVNIVEPETLRIRTYERGVNRVTLACGTGAVAAACALAHTCKLPSPLNMHVLSGDVLKISFTPDWNTITLRGPAKRIESGTFSFNDKSSILSPS